MPHTLQQTVPALVAGELFAPLRARGASVLARLAARHRQAATRAALAELSEAQLKDVGAARWAGQTEPPPIEVDAALMRRLMSWR